MSRRNKHEHKEFDSLIDCYLAYYPWNDSEIDEWIELNDWTAIAVMQNGRSFLFDDVERKLREVYVIKDTLNLSDDMWAIGFGQRLQDAIYRSRLNNYELADLIGVTPVMLSRYINGKAIPKAQIVHRIATILDCAIDELMPRDYILLSH